MSVFNLKKKIELPHSLPISLSSARNHLSWSSLVNFNPDETTL